MAYYSVPIIKSMVLLGWSILSCMFLYISIHDILKNFDDNKCQMTYMFEWPDYIKLSLGKEIKNKYPKFDMYLYGEGRHGHTSRKVKLHGIPVLFIPGNAGSHKQVRSLASVALRKAEDGRYRNHFDYFTVDLDEGLTGVYGGELLDQTNFVRHCIAHILHLYEKVKHRPSSVILIGHSMGGIIARAVFTLKNFDISLVHTIITLGTPHESPVVPIDSHMSNFYHKINTYWKQSLKDKQSAISNVTIASIGGSFRDLVVPSQLVSLSASVSVSRSLSVVSDAVPKVWLQIDHLCLCWCKQLVQTINRALFDMIQPTTKQITQDPSLRMKILNLHLVSNSGVSVYQKKLTAEEILKRKQIVLVEEKTWSSQKCSGKVHLFPIKATKSDSFVAFTGHLQGAWIYACKEESCLNMKDLSGYGRILPSTRGDIRALNIKLNKLRTFTHIAIITPSFATAEFFSSAYSSQLSSMSKTVFSNISLNSIASIWEVYEIKINLENCTSANSLLSGRLHTPWFNQDTYIKPNTNLVLTLKLHKACPRGCMTGPQLHIWASPSCKYSISVEQNFQQTLGQLMRVIALLIPNTVFSLLFIIITRQTSLWQQSCENSLLDVLFSDKWFYSNLLFLLIILTFIGGSTGFDWFPVLLSISLSLFVIIFSYLAFKGCALIGSFFLRWHTSQEIYVDNRRINLTWFSMILVFVLLMSFTTCGGISIFMVNFVLFCMLVKECDSLRALNNKMSEKEDDPNIEKLVKLREHNYYIKETLFILLTFISIFCMPSMAVWAKGIQNSRVLKNDPFGILTPLICVNVVCLVFFPLLHVAPKHLSYLSTMIAFASIRVLPLQNLFLFLAFYLTVKNIVTFLDNQNYSQKDD